MRLSLLHVACTLVSAAVLPGCFDENPLGEQRSPYVKVVNEQDEPVFVAEEVPPLDDYEPPTIEVDAGSSHSLVSVSAGDWEEACLRWPLIATDGSGREIERLPQSLCWSEYYEWVIDGDPDPAE